jgi:hypothetical protein
MNDQPSVDAHGEHETKPSLLATVSLVLALVPYVLMIQWILAHFWHLPVWIRSILTYVQTELVPVALMSPLIGLVCGCVALVKMRKDPLLCGKWKANTGIGLAVIFYLSGVLLPRLGGGPKAPAPNCIVHLKAVSTAITLYADDHEDQMPSTLEEMVDGTYIPLRSTILACPLTGQKYQFLGAKKIWRTNDTEVAVYCNGDHRGMRNVMFNRGYVRTITPDELEKLLADAEKAGQSDR